MSEEVADQAVKATRAPATDRTKSTLFIRNLPFNATNKEFEEFFSEYGPLKACFVVTEHKDGAAPTEEGGVEEVDAGRSKGFGFVNYALEEDAARALEGLKATKFMGRRLKGELAMRKHVKYDPTSAKPAAKLTKPEAKPTTEPFEKKKKQVQPRETSRSTKVEITFISEKPVEFNKKQLYKKVRKVAELTELVYPAKDDPSKAIAVFASSEEALRAAKKLDKHIFKGIKMTAEPILEANVKAHRLIVRNLPFKLSPSVLDEHFGAFGRVLEVVLPRNESGRLRGFAFVQFAERPAAERAMGEVNGKELAGRTVAVDWAVGKTLYEQIVNSENNASVAKTEDKCEDDGVVDEDEDDIDLDDEEEEDNNDDEGGEDIQSGGDDTGKTVFIRNIAFESSEEALRELMTRRFGPLEYCKLVMNGQTGASRGTAFVKFLKAESASKAVEASALLSQDAVAGGPKEDKEAEDALKRKRTGKLFKSVLVDNDLATPGSQEAGILLDGRALSVVSAVDREAAGKLRLLQQEDTSKSGRRLELLNEAEIKPVSPAAHKFWKPEDVRERHAGIKARLSDLKRNPNSVISNVRLSVRHLPPALDEEQLKSVMEHLLAEAVPQAAQVLADQSEAMQANAVRAKARLRQIKIVRAGPEEKESRAGRSKGYAFIELMQPAHALLLLRYALNYAPDVWNRMLPDIFGRRVKTANEKKPRVPVLEFAIDKTAVLERSATGSVGKKAQVHRPAAKRPTESKKRRPGFNQKSSSKRQKK